MPLIVPENGAEGMVEHIAANLTVLSALLSAALLARWLVVPSIHTEIVRLALLSEQALAHCSGAKSLESAGVAKSTFVPVQLKRQTITVLTWK